MKDTLSFLVQSLLQKNKINIDSEELDFQIQSHPSYPSLHAITGVLSHFNVDNIAIRVPIDKETLEQLPNSFIAQLKIDSVTDFALVIKQGENYKTIHNNKEKKSINQTSFLKKFTGIVVGVEKDKTKNTNEVSTTSYEKPLLASALALLVILFIYSTPGLYASIYFGLAITGIAVSLLVIQHDLGISSKIIDSICSQESKTTNCNTVLNSKGATIYKNIKLSDISLVYFLSISISTVFTSLTSTSINTLYLISLTATSVVVYSIYYQIKISKNWCILCLAIASILVLQASIYFLSYATFSMLKIETTLIIGFTFITIASVWLFISSKLKQEQDFKKLKIQSSKFKRNFDLFNTLLQKSKKVNTSIPNTPEIVFGNLNASLNVTIITNPFCGHCKSVHNLIEDILKKYHNTINITVRFNITTSNLESNGVLVTSRLMELFNTKGEVICLEAMHDIYNNGDIKAWLDKWKRCNNTANYINSLEAENKWCVNNSINFTPEILINGKSYPKAYNRKDLTYFVEELNEAYTPQQTTSLQATL
ncbi:vitamin K epoxide reductase family protein [Olleya sp. Bg11-27]|uniref:vitamin K epoxide reductase family protein n=1 Tax=Olleya sp. Bg11-27 TaxID=2058135 RepID=UPI000C30B840|nr:vitamin K epoxide reductase family protein [Olleya sp. Bg11-27]AUC75476.1 hypothetical protein CW732_07210 [Olleya sp. Bg11-27]